MANNVLGVFNQALPDLQFDKALALKVQRYARAFVNKNPDHIAFFGGMLMGVQRVRFRPEDRNEWFDDILEADDLAIEEALHRLPDIEAHRHVSSDVMNLSCLWMVHRFYTSTRLSVADKEEAMINVLLILQYKFITSILARWFPYSADPQVAIATVAALSMKYGLKTAGSWGKLLYNRSVEILAKRSIHYATYTKFTSDEAIVYMVNDIQGRIKKILKHIRDVFEKVRKDPKGLIRTSTSTVELDGINAIRDKKRAFPSYLRYVNDVIKDPVTWLKPELVDVIDKAMNSVNKAKLEQTLYYMSVNSGAGGDPDVDTLVEETLAHAFEFILSSARNEVRVGDLGGLLFKLKNRYMASRSTDASLLSMRELGENIAQAATNSRVKAELSALRTSIMLYIVLRAFSMKHYTSASIPSAA
ncbi:hypothetical protein ACLPJK_26085 [Pseudomonas aeruginosa]|uniref:hypothetical protein n=1 Tax=Pseudomonas aeruginosa TaxID=287 RepID=UPI003D2E817B